MTLTDFNTQYADLQKSFRQQSKPLTVTLITLSGLVANAKASLSPDDFILFQRHNALSNPQHVKRMVRIGRSANTLKPFADSLPPSLSALFHLSRLDTDALTGIVADGQVNPFTPTEQVKALVQVHIGKAKRGRPEKTATSNRPAEYTITLEFFPATFDTRNAKSVLKTLNAFITKHGEALALVPDVKLSLDLELALMEDEREDAAA